MAYIVIDKETGLEITGKVQVIQDTQDSYIYCRKKADDMFKQADVFYEAEIEPKYKELINCSMDDFGEMFDPLRADKWSVHCDKLKSEIEQLNKEHSAMIDIGGDWEDKEYAARVKPLVNMLAAGDKNPLRYKVFKMNLWKDMVEYMECPSLGKYLV